MLVCFEATLLTLLLSSLIYVSCKLSKFIECMSCHVCVSYSACHVYVLVCHDAIMYRISIGFSDDRRFGLGKVRICVNTKRRQVEAEKGRNLGVAVSFFPFYVCFVSSSLVDGDETLRLFHRN